MKTKNNSSKNQKLTEALKKFAAAAQELANMADEFDYTPSECAPEYLQELDDFAYEVTSFVEDEIEELTPVETDKIIA